MDLYSSQNIVMEVGFHGWYDCDFEASFSETYT